MSEFNLKKRKFSEVSDADLDQKVESVIKDFPHLGERMIHQIMKGQGLCIQRSRLRESIYRVDEAGVESRKKGRLKRRTYNVKGPNHLWHIDTHHKLIRWYFVVVGIVDGFSRLPVALKCTDNSRSETVFSCFLDAVENYGTPSRVRSD